MNCYFLRKRFKAAAMAAGLFMTYGYRTVMCMAGRGPRPPGES